MKSTLLLSELRSLAVELKQCQSGITERDQSSCSAEITRKVELARKKLDDLRQTQQREKDFEARRREIERENARH